MNTKKEKGFTLIELLVVIAIIGVLSSIVLAALNNSRDRANDAKTKAQLSGLRAAAELYYNSTGNYTYGAETNLCNNMFSNSLVSPYIEDLPGGAARCRALVGSNPSYAVSAPLLSQSGWWCVDSAGYSKRITTNLGSGDTTCN